MTNIIIIKNNIQFKIKSFDKKLLNLTSLYIMKACISHNVNISTVCLPQRSKKYTLLRSPHVDKKARDQFEICTYTRLITIFNNDTFEVNDQIISKVLKYLPYGIFLKINKTKESLN